MEGSVGQLVGGPLLTAGRTGTGVLDVVALVVRDGEVVALDVQEFHREVVGDLDRGAVVLPLVSGYNAAAVGLLQLHDGSPVLAVPAVARRESRHRREHRS